MNLLVLPPPPDLRPWLDGGVVVRTDAGVPFTRFPALVGSMLVVRVAGAVVVAGDRAAGEHRLPARALIGPATAASAYRHVGAVHAVGVLVRPEAVPILLRASVANLADVRLALGDTGMAAAGAGMGLSSSALEDAVCSAPDDAARLGVLFEAVRVAVEGARNDARRQLLSHMRAAVSQAPVTEDARALGWSTRQFERRFVDGFGLPPKQFQVIARVQAAMHAALQYDGVDRSGVGGTRTGISTRTGTGTSGAGARIAVDHGYFDQAHLARDLRRFAGASLSALVRCVGDPLPIGIDAQHAQGTGDPGAHGTGDPQPHRAGGVRPPDTGDIAERSAHWPWRAGRTLAGAAAPDTVPRTLTR